MVRQSRSLILCTNRLLKLSRSSTKVPVQISKFRHSCQCLHSRGFLGILYLPDMSGSVMKSHDHKQEFVTLFFPRVVSHCFPLTSPNKFANPGQTLIDLNLQQFHLGRYQYSMIHATKARQEHTQIALTTLKQCSHSTHILLDGWEKASSLALITDAITCP